MGKYEVRRVEVDTGTSRVVLGALVTDAGAIVMIVPDRWMGDLDALGYDAESVVSRIGSKRFYKLSEERAEEVAEEVAELVNAEITRVFFGDGVRRTWERRLSERSELSDVGHVEVKIAGQFHGFEASSLLRQWRLGRNQAREALSESAA